MLSEIIQIVKPFSEFGQILRFAQKRSVGFMFYDKFKELCTARSVSISKAATDIGLSNSTPTKWKNTNATPDSTTLAKIADYFGVTVDYLLGTEKEKAPTPEGERPITLDDFTYAMQDEAKDLTEMDKQLLLSMAKQLNDARKKRDGESG